jgi:hypothetical protein
MQQFLAMHVTFLHVINVTYVKYPAAYAIFATVLINWLPALQDVSEKFNLFPYYMVLEFIFYVTLLHHKCE